MKKLFLFLITLTITILFISCKENKLSREKATELILQKINLPEDMILYFNVNNRIQNDIPGDMAVYINDESYVNAGLLFHTQPDNMLWDAIQFTDEGKRYVLPELIILNGTGLINNDYRIWTNNKGYGSSFYNSSKQVGVKVGKIKFGEITGILDNNQSANNSVKVDYTLIINNLTPFGESLRIKDGKLSENMRINFSSYFVKYDDGWRINN